MRAASILVPPAFAVVLGAALLPAFGTLTPRSPLPDRPSPHPGEGTPPPTRAGGGGSGRASGPETSGFDPARVSWTRLKFKAEKLFLTVYSEVELRTRLSSEVEPALIPSPRSVALMPSGPELLELRLDSSGGRDSIRVWFTAHDARALQRLKLRGGKKAYKKIFRFTREGTYSLRTAPRNRREGRLPPEQWTQVEEFFYPYAWGSSCPVISEPSLLFYAISAARLPAGGEPVGLCVFSRKSVIPLEIAARGSRRLAVDYAETSAQGQRRRTGEITTSEISMRVRELGDEAEKADFKFVGLAGDVAIYLEESSRIPVQVSGRIPGLGGVDIKLIEVDLVKTMGVQP